MRCVYVEVRIRQLRLPSFPLSHQGYRQEIERKGEINDQYARCIVGNIRYYYKSMSARLTKGGRSATGMRTLLLERFMVSKANETFMQFERRADTSDPDKLIATFVNVGALVTLLSTRDHQIIFGRRGTGKTHAFHYLNDVRRRAKDISIYIDLRTIGSSIGIYNDPTRTLPERSTVLLRDVLSAIHDGLLDFATTSGENIDLSKIAPVLDNLADAISNTRVVGPLSVKDTDASKVQNQSKAGIDLALASSGPKLKVAFGADATDENAHTRETAFQLDAQPSVIFGSVESSLRRFSELVKPRRIWILVDEWSTVPADLQPYLADLVRRALFPVQNITVKIAAIEHRTKFRMGAAQGAYIGIEVGADASADINLDDFMVFENDPTRATAFFADLIYRHYVALVGNENLPNADSLIRTAFTQRNVFDELVKAAEGVPRDAINILNVAAQKALEDKININHVRAAARDWYQRDKSRILTESADVERLLNWIVERVIGTRQARAFLLSTAVIDSRIEELFDGRVLHVLKKNVSSNEQPGIRYRVYKIDYGCYVDLINTAKSPSRLFQAEEASGTTVDVEVPTDDYRSIRRAILDLGDYERATASLN